MASRSEVKDAIRAEIRRTTAPAAGKKKRAPL
jgi:hypothetical protein